MRKVRFGHTQLDVTPICYGTWEIGGFPFYRDCLPDTAIALVRDVYQAGINFFDTAPVYGFGRAERLLGEALKDVRSEVVISSKCGLRFDKESLSAIVKDASADFIKRDLEGSLQRLQTDYIDLYMIHWPDVNTPIETSIRTLQQLKEEGLIRFFGVSNFSYEQLRQACDCGQVSVVQSRMSRIHQEFSENMAEWCLEQAIGVQAYSPLERGLLTDQTVLQLKARNEAAVHWALKECPEDVLTQIPLWQEEAKSQGLSFAQWAVRWVLSQKAVVAAIVGSTQLEHILLQCEHV